VALRCAHAAVEDAHAATGVDAVYDELNLRPLPRDPRDDEFRSTVLQLLIRDPRVPETTIDVAVADSWVTLKGRVEKSARERRRIRGRGKARRRRRHH
jgi:osmotically-inducible protein OsmY